jgi:hypothetical protein
MHLVNRRHTDIFISITTIIDTSTAARLTPHTTIVTNNAHINTMATGYYLCPIVTNYEFRRQINQKLIVQNSTEILLAGPKLLHAGRQTDVTQRTVDFGNVVN